MVHNRLDNLPIDKEQSTLLVEETEEINIGDVENVRKIHLAKSLNPKEKKTLFNFFCSDQSTFHGRMLICQG